jgi:hypothetical protein
LVKRGTAAISDIFRGGSSSKAAKTILPWLMKKTGVSEEGANMIYDLAEAGGKKVINKAYDAASKRGINIPALDYMRKHDPSVNDHTV